MKLCRFSKPGHEARVGVVTEGSSVRDLTAVGLPDLSSLIEADDPLAELQKIVRATGVSIQEVNAPVSSGGEDTGIVSDVQSPLQPPTGPTPEPWDGVKPVTVLVMGLDYRDWISNEGPPRTDTMILLMLDPVNRTAGMLNIPRDLWVNIPGGYNYGRINTAYQLGEAYKLPGGGAGLAMETVEELLGVPIDYYAQIDFSAFERFIDELDGIYVEIPEEIVVDPLGDDNTKRIKPGLKRLSGPVALAYARARKSEGGDFDRAQRQQQVILAIRDRILDLNLLPTLIARAPVLYSELSAGVHTNLNLDQTIKLAWLATPGMQAATGINTIAGISLWVCWLSD